MSSISVYSQSKDCGDIDKIGTEIKSSEIDGKKSIKLILPDDVKLTSLEIFLFAPRRENNRMNLKTEEVDGLLPGKYLLIIQSKRNSNCTRKISLEI